jgi:hypothetical protein
MKIPEVLEYLKGIYGDKKAMTISELKNRMKVSEITIHRKLKKTGALTSYNKNGMFYTLPHIPKFDAQGLWVYNDIRFSKHGNMNRTIIQLINQSGSGLHAGEIEGLIGYAPHSLLHQLSAKSAIHRKKLKGRYVYFSIDKQVFKSQLHSYTAILQAQYSENDMPCLAAVRLLIEKIKKPKDSLASLLKILRRDNVKINESQVKRFFKKHGLEKKTPD